MKLSIANKAAIVGALLLLELTVFARMFWASNSYYKGYAETYKANTDYQSIKIAQKLLEQAEGFKLNLSEQVVDREELDLLVDLYESEAEFKSNEYKEASNTISSEMNLYWIVLSIINFSIIGLCISWFSKSSQPNHAKETEI